MSIDLAELRRLAEAATPGPWIVGRLSGNVIADPLFSGYVVSPHDESPKADEDMAFIAAFNPVTAAALLDRIEANEPSVLQDDLKELLDALGMPSGAQPRTPHGVMRTAIERAASLLDRIEAVRAECKRRADMHLKDAQNNAPAAYVNAGMAAAYDHVASLLDGGTP